MKESGTSKSILETFSLADTAIFAVAFGPSSITLRCYNEARNPVQVFLLERSLATMSRVARNTWLVTHLAGTQSSFSEFERQLRYLRFVHLLLGQRGMAAL